MRIRTEGVHPHRSRQPRSRERAEWREPPGLRRTTPALARRVIAVGAVLLFAVGRAGADPGQETCGAADPGHETSAAGDPGQETSDTADRWPLLRLLVGHWRAAIAGRLGTGTGVRHYEFILDDKFLLFRHESVRVPQEKSPDGDYHQELGVFSYDTERRTLVLREFFIEGVVSRYTCNVDGQRIVCVTEHVESGPGIRARLTLDIRDAYVFEETFEIAFSQEAELAVYFTNRWTRVPMLGD